MNASVTTFLAIAPPQASVTLIPLLYRCLRSVSSGSEHILVRRVSVPHSPLAHAY
jgi:hypothetical protein